MASSSVGNAHPENEQANGYHDSLRRIPDDRTEIPRENAEDPFNNAAWELWPPAHETVGEEDESTELGIIEQEGLNTPFPGIHPTPPPSGTVLERGLQIPTRMSYITSGFRLPSKLRDAGVDGVRWKAFTREIKSQSALSGSQMGLAD